jgi:hypothetical protein
MKEKEEIKNLHCIQGSKLFDTLLNDGLNLRQITDISDNTHGIYACRFDFGDDLINALLICFDVVDT